MPSYTIHADIEQAETLPSSFYKSQTVFDALKEKVFARSWQFVGDDAGLALSGQVQPFDFEGTGEPMLLSRKGDDIHCLSNVCTHRGNLLCHHPGLHKQITCQYHGRRFGLNGRFQHMPQFKEAKDFPREADHLHEFPLKQWGPWLFASLGEGFDFDPVLEAMDRKVGFLPLHQFKLDQAHSKDYLVNAHWALYCDNYLEGFHIPFVHADLNAVLDYGSYETVIYDHTNLQIGYADGADHIFDLPEGHEDYGKRIAAYYFWVFPNMMFNFYPWGLSINVVRPISLQKTRVSFISYIYDESQMTGSSEMLDKVEREDEFVVEGVQKGMQSRVYHTGRYSPTMERGVHHFHGLLAKFLG